MGFLAMLLSSGALGALNLLFGTIGKTVTDIHTSNTKREESENQSGVENVHSFVGAQTSAGAQRADVQKAQGAWGPFGLAGFIIAIAFAFHVAMIVMDSTSWHLIPTLKWYVLPWLEWQPHSVGSWKVAALPGLFEQTEHEILRALFYVGPPSAAIAIVAKALQRR